MIGTPSFEIFFFFYFCVGENCNELITMNLPQDQFNSITCNPDDYTCSDPNLIFNVGCNPDARTADPTCAESGSHNNHGCHPMNPMCWMDRPTDGSVSLANYALYKV